MKKRGYRLGKRAALLNQTRSDLIRTARKLINSHGFHGISLEALARKAGVTRVTIYNQFGSKLGLLEAILDDVGKRGKIGSFVTASKMENTTLAAEGMVKELCRFWESDRKLLSRLVGLAAIDPETKGLIELRENLRHRTISDLVSRISREGKICPGYSEPEVTAILTALTSFSTFDQLLRAGEPSCLNPPNIIIGLIGRVIRLWD